MALYMILMNTDMMNMNTDYVDHEHRHVSVHGDSRPYKKHISGLIRAWGAMKTDMSVFMGTQPK